LDSDVTLFGLGGEGGEVAGSISMQQGVYNDVTLLSLQVLDLDVLLAHH